MNRRSPAPSTARGRVLSAMSRPARRASTIHGNPLSTLVRPNGTSGSSRVISHGCRQSALSSPTSITILHDGSVRVGDTWLKVHFGGYAEWAKTSNSLLIITFDEDDISAK